MSKEVQDIDITVMSFNIRGWSDRKQDGVNAWVSRAQFSTETINKHAPYIAGLQEYDHRMNTPVFAEHLPHYERVNGPECVPDRYNPVLWTPSRLALVEHSGFWLSETPDQKSIGWGSSEERAATTVLFRDLQLGSQFLHVNTHFEVRVDQARIESARLILQRTERYRRDGMPIVVTGDFNASHYLAPNAVYTSTPHNLFTSEGFTDAFLHAHPNSPNPPYTFHDYEGREYKGDKYGSWLIDHILHRGFTQRSYAILRDAQTKEPKYPSDHYPIMAQLALS